MDTYYMTIFLVEYCDNEPYEYNTYTIGYYAQLRDALKAKYRTDLRIIADGPHYIEPECTIHSIQVIKGN